MAPYLRDGDVVVTTALKGAPRSGDVVVYKENGPGFFVAHRVESVGPLGATTRGDANATLDPLEVKDDQIVGRVRLVIPWMGHLLALLRGRN
jgi:signal peptidase I